ncbi:MAG: type II toxin-antitoxin system VapC family toxin [Actinomycetota bacterium]
MSLFVDTSAWYAAADTGDRSNQRAIKVLRSEEPMVTSDHVLVETWLLIRRRLGMHAANRFWGGLRSGVAAIEPVGVGDLELAWEIGEAFPDQAFSVVDRTSFALMQRLGFERVATFDSDFAVYRFGPKRDRAFTVVG